MGSIVKQIKTILLLIIAGTTACIHVSAQICPPNIDFENGTFSNWKAYRGGVSAATGSNVIDSLVMDQTIFLNALADKQRFVSSTKTAGTAPAQVAPAAPGFKFAANTDVPATYLTWTPTQQIQAIWVAQSVSNAGSVPGVAGAFSVSLLNNLATNTSVGITNVTGTALATEFATGGSLASMFVPTPVF